jgi:uncharacterized paraquat-inducible protein A
MVVCSKCEVVPNAVTDAQGEEEAVCPRCGQRDKLKDAARIARQHTADQMKALISQEMQGAARSSRVMEIASEFTRHDLRWKVLG